MRRASIAVSFLVAVYSLAHAQDPGSSQQPPPLPPTTDAAPSAQAPNTDPSTKKEKKVWTNENLSDVKGPFRLLAEGMPESLKSRRLRPRTRPTWQTPKRRSRSCAAISTPRTNKLQGCA